MTTIADRITERLGELGWSERELSRRTRALDPARGVSDSFVRNLRSAKALSPKVDTVTLVADALGVRYEWLAHGAGPKWPDAGSDPERQLLELFRGLPDAERDAVLRVLEATRAPTRRTG